MTTIMLSLMGNQGQMIFPINSPIPMNDMYQGAMQVKEGKHEKISNNADG
jgi:hypothetical protein